MKVISRPGRILMKWRVKTYLRYHVKHTWLNFGLFGRRFMVCHFEAQKVDFRLVGKVI